MNISYYLRNLSKYVRRWFPLGKEGTSGDAGGANLRTLFSFLLYN